jgi:hypothetical protein
MPQEAIAICDAGLIANPNDFMILNNKIVALSRFGDTRNAEKILASLTPSTTEEQIYVAAATGLVSFRKGLVAQARISYSIALSLAKEVKAWDTEFRGAMHWLYEEFAAGQISRSHAIEILEKIRPGILKSPSFLKSTLDFADNLLARFKTEFDAASNFLAIDLSEHIDNLLKRQAALLSP